MHIPARHSIRLLMPLDGPAARPNRWLKPHIPSSKRGKDDRARGRTVASRPLVGMVCACAERSAYRAGWRMLGRRRGAGRRRPPAVSEC